MADGLNRVMLLGNIGADPELKMTQGGKAILKIRLATAESYLDKSNTRQERTEWHSVTLFGNRAEALSRILKKGARVFVEGSLHTSSYDKGGEKRYRTEVNVSNVILCGGQKGGEAHPGRESATRSTPETSSRSNQSQSDWCDEGYGEEIPF